MASSPAPSAAMNADGKEDAASVTSVAGATSPSAAAAAGAVPDDTNMNKINDNNFSALLKWLGTFPDLAEVITDDDNGSSSCNFNDRNVAVAMLQTVKEIYNDDPDVIADTSTSSYSASEIWGQILATADISDDIKDAEEEEDSLSNASIEALLSTLLCRAVSGDCPMQKTYIGRIMDLESELQMSLMKIISDANNINNNTDNEGGDDDDNDGDDGTVGGASVASVVESILSRQRGRDEASVLLRSGYTPQRKKRATNDDEDGVAAPSSSRRQHPLSAVRMNRSANDEIFSPVGSVFSPTSAAAAAAAEGCNGRSRSNSNNSRSYDQSPTIDAKKEMQELKGKLEFVSTELEVARQRETELGSKLDDIESKHRAEKMKIEADSIAREKDMSDKHTEELASLRKEVEELRGCRNDAHDAKEDLDALRDEVDVLQHTKERLASTEEQFRKCREKLEQMGDAKEALFRAEEAHGSAVARSLELENELKALQPLRRQLEDYKTRAVDAEVKLTETLEELQNLQKLSSELSGMNKELKQGVMIHQSETEGLRKRLLEDSESSEGTKGPAVGEGLSELNPALMAEVQSLRNENARLRAFAAQRENDSVQKLEESLDDNQRLAQRYKEQFLTTKNELQEAQQALRDSLLREEKLKLEISALNNDVSNLKTELKDERLTSQTALLDAERALQETKQSLIEKAREDIENLESKMNGLLEDEQNRGKEALEKAEEEKKSIEEQSSKALAELEEKTSSALKSAQEEAEQRISEMEKQHASALEAATKEAKDEREKLVAKGKSMIKDIKAKAQDELTAKEEAHAAEKEEIKQMCAQFTQEQKDYEERARAKIAQYKQKLHVATSRQNDLTQEAEELQERLKKREREKMNLQGENDRYRRQLGCRFGSDNDAQQQFEMLQREFSQMLEENKGLKKKLSAGGASPFEIGVFPTGGAVASSREYVGSGSKDTSTISQLRAEYEDTIQTLQDEKRELVMKNSAAISDAQKADQRSWELEEELNKVKNQLTSAKLSLQRAERNTTPIDTSFAKVTSPDHANTSIQSFHSTMQEPAEQKGSGVQEQVDNPAAKENQGNPAALSSCQNRKPRSLIASTQISESQDGKPECQQS